MVCKNLIALVAVLASISWACAAPSGGVHHNPMENPGMYQGDIAGIDPLDRNIFTSFKKLWTNNTVYYQLAPALEEDREVIEGAMKVYMRLTKNCLKFVNGKGIGNYLYMDELGGCWSYFGMNGGKQQLSLNPGCRVTGVVLHELGHALGFYHEQNRSDRDEYIRIYWQNVANGQKSQFEKNKPYENYLVTAYDYHSIMEYGSYTFSKNGRRTLTTINGDDIESPNDKKTITPSDLIELNTLYSCNGRKHPPPKVPDDIHCGFTDNNCIFTVEDIGSGKMGRTRDNTGNYFMTASGTGQEYLLSSQIYFQDQYACISFRYQVERSNSLEINFMEFFTNDKEVDKKIRLSTDKTKGWQFVKFQIHAANPVTFSWNIRAIPNAYTIVTFDDFDVLYRKC